MTQLEIPSSLFRFLLLLLSNEGKKEDKEEEISFCGARTMASAGKKNKRSKSRNAFLIAGETEKNNDPSRREKTHVMAGMFSDSWRARVCAFLSTSDRAKVYKKEVTQFHSVPKGISARDDRKILSARHLKKINSPFLD